MEKSIDWNALFEQAKQILGKGVKPCCSMKSNGKSKSSCKSEGKCSVKTVKGGFQGHICPLCGKDLKLTIPQYKKHLEAPDPEHNIKAKFHPDIGQDEYDKLMKKIIDKTRYTTDPNSPVPKKPAGSYKISFEKYMKKHGYFKPTTEEKTPEEDVPVVEALPGVPTTQANVLRKAMRKKKPALEAAIQIAKTVGEVKRRHKKQTQPKVEDLEKSAIPESAKLEDIIKAVKGSSPSSVETLHDIGKKQSSVKKTKKSASLRKEAQQIEKKKLVLKPSKKGIRTTKKKIALIV